MGFRKDNYAKVWSVETVSDTNTKIRISTSKKNKQTGEYEQDFSGFVSCVGSAAASRAAALKEGDRIKLGDVDVTTKYVKENNATYTNFTVFSFDVEEGNSAANQKPAQTTEPQPSVDSGEVEDDRLPF